MEVIGVSELECSCRYPLLASSSAVCIAVMSVESLSSLSTEVRSRCCPQIESLRPSQSLSPLAVSIIRYAITRRLCHFYQHISLSYLQPVVWSSLRPIAVLGDPFKAIYQQFSQSLPYHMEFLVILFVVPS